jgi:hypothetical protein
MSPVLKSIDQIDFTPRPTHSSARANESSTVSLSAASWRRMSLGRGITASHTCRRARQPSSACLSRRPPSKLNGSVTKAMTSAPCPRRRSRPRSGEAPPPVPPPIPARRKTRSQSLTTAAIFSRSASAASRPSSGSPPAPRPRVDAHADQHLVLHGRARKRLVSVLMTGELQAVEVLHLEAVDGVGSGAADADQLDRHVAVGEQRAWCSRGSSFRSIKRFRRSRRAA